MTTSGPNFLTIARDVLQVQRDICQGQRDIRNGKLEGVKQLVERSLKTIADLKLKVGNQPFADKNHVLALENSCNGLKLRLDIRNAKVSTPVQNRVPTSNSNPCNSNPTKKDPSEERRKTILDKLESIDRLTLDEFNAFKKELGEKDVVAVLEDCILLPLTSMVTEFVGTKKDVLDLSYCQNLQKFDCRGLSSKAFQKLIPELPPSLTELNIALSMIDSNKSLGLLLAQCPRLQEMVLRERPWVNDATMKLLAPHTGLRGLDLSFCENVTNPGLKVLFNGNGSLNHLNLSRTHCVDDETLAMLASCKTLRHLVAGFCGNITNNGLRILLKENPYLTHLDLPYNEFVNDETMDILGTHPRLQHIDLSNCQNASNAGLRILLKNNLKLAELDLRYNDWVNNETMDILALHPGLRRMDLSFCDHITNDGLKVFLDGNQQLTMLELFSLVWVDDDTMSLLALLHDLKRVNLGQCQHITNTGLRPFLEANLQLSQLDLRANNWVDNETMGLLAAHTGLSYICLINCQSVTNNGLRTLLEKNRQLAKLDLSENAWVNNDTLQILANLQVKEVNLTHCPNVKKPAIVELRRVCPDMIIHY